MAGKEPTLSVSWEEFLVIFATCSRLVIFNFICESQQGLHNQETPNIGAILLGYNSLLARSLLSGHPSMTSSQAKTMPLSSKDGFSLQRNPPLSLLSFCVETSACNPKVLKRKTLDHISAINRLSLRYKQRSATHLEPPRNANLIRG